MARQPLKWKKSTLAAAAGIALCLAATGTLASLTGNDAAVLAAGTAPGVSLHDDFAGGPEKHVYAENSGGEAMLTRIRLTELLALSDGTLLPQGAADDEAGTGWHRHAAATADLANCGFAGHDYFTWTLGGYKAYMPAAPSALAQGEYSDRDTFIAPRDVGDTLAVLDYGPLLKDAFTADGNTDALTLLERWLAGDGAVAQPLQKAIAALPDSLTVADVLQYPGQSEAEQIRRLNEVRLTASSTQLLSMAEWDAGGRQLGDFWVMDSDGWCYWARSLSAGEATGLLMSACHRSPAAPDDLTYKIRAELDAVTTDPSDINDYLTKNHALDDISESAVLLTLLSSGSYTYGQDGAFYLPRGDNTYLCVLQNEGSYANYLLGERICAEADRLPGSGDDLKPGQGIAVHQDGTLYRITNEDGSWTPDGSWAGPYAIREIVSGENGVAYLTLSNGGCCCSVGSLDPDSSDYLTPTTLGLGPYRLVWPGEDGVIGTADDLYQEDFAAVETGGTTQFYRRLTQKVYARVAALGSPDPALYLSDDGLYYLDREGNYINETDLTALERMADQQYTGAAAPLYYAAGGQYAALEASTFALEAMTGTDPAGTASLTYGYLESYTFQFLLGTPFKFAQGTGYLFPGDADYAASTADAYELTPAGVVPGADGVFYLRTEVSQTAPVWRWYMGPGPDDILGTADDVPLKAGADSAIGTADDHSGGTLTESFLVSQGLTSDTLTVGATFDTDSYNWVVLAIDGDGNRLVTSTGATASFAFGSSTVYEGSTLKNANDACPDWVPTLKPFVQPVDIPQNGLSTVGTTYDCIGFPLSAADYEKYKTVLDAHWGGGSYSLRSSSTEGYVDIIQYDDTTKTGTLATALPSVAMPTRPCMWVRFSDAEAIDPQEPPLEFLPADFTGLPGDRLWANGYDWVVLSADEHENLMLMTVEQVEEMGERGQNNAWPGRALTFTEKLTSLTPYARVASIPTEIQYSTGVTWDQITDGLSTASEETDGAVSFVLSAGEHAQLICAKPGMVKYRTTPGKTTWAVRSRVNLSSSSYPVWMYVDGNGNYGRAWSTVSHPPRMALWVHWT